MRFPFPVAPNKRESPPKTDPVATPSCAHVLRICGKAAQGHLEGLHLVERLLRQLLIRPQQLLANETQQNPARKIKWNHDNQAKGWLGVFELFGWLGIFELFGWLASSDYLDGWLLRIMFQRARGHPSFRYALYISQLCTPFLHDAPLQILLRQGEIALSLSTQQQGSTLGTASFGARKERKHRSRLLSRQPAKDSRAALCTDT